MVRSSSRRTDRSITSGSLYHEVRENGRNPVDREVGHNGVSSSHAHAKSAFIYAYVVSGAIESEVNDGPKRIYRAGESFFEEPGSLHRVSRNASKTEPAKLLAVFVVDTNDKPLTTAVK